MSFFVQKSPVHGRGVFAGRKIIAGEQFSFPVILVPKSLDLVHKFPWDRENSSIVLGHFSLCNSSDKPNMKIHTISKLYLTKTFIATENISAGDEIFLKYRL
ncbi:SET domain protein [Stenotrophomonas maltophilia phage vB_SmaM_Ps15]|uniref:SET domain protein n=1 Tax=Stenotrophomonas maltophilia phage vB_SmaM_Ps15 TaxID=3071007 RepID=A0AAE9FH93_9CAUD|nr:SET domain protein [Stenotrophomonas maltophilia phage vB_SmaM_Ps15]UMO77213.1 SET domain protein [Stenotrophomonas maltophilia phage vB_SmaM_Ps15]